MMPKPFYTLYTAEFDGQTFKRRSGNVYTHAAIFRSELSEKLTATFHTSETLARRATMPRPVVRRDEPATQAPIAVVPVR